MSKTNRSKRWKAQQKRNNNKAYLDMNKKASEDFIATYGKQALQNQSGEFDIY